jgi:putative membrane protein
MARLLTLFVLLASPVSADVEGYGHMMDWGYGYGVGVMFGPVLWLLVVGLVVAGLIWLVRRTEHMPPRSQTSSALAELDMRLAKGEIDIEEYATRKKALSS